MTASTRRRITAKELQDDIDAFYALKLLTDYKPHDPNATVEAIAPIVDKIRAKQEAIIAHQVALDAMRDDLNDSSLELHGRMGVSKNEVRAQYGDNSNQIASLGLKKKSEHKPRRPKKVKAKTETAE